MKKTFIIVLSALVLTGCAGKKEDTPVPQSVEENAPPSVEAFGKVIGTEERSVYLEFPCLVKSLNVQAGERISAGDRLLTLGAYDGPLQEAQSLLSIARYTLRQLENSTRTAEEETQRRYKTLRNNIRIAREELEENQEKYKEKSRQLTEQEDTEIKKILNDLAKARNELKNNTTELENNKILFQQGAVAEKVVQDYEEKVEQTRSGITTLTLNLEGMVNTRTRELSDLKLLISQKETQLANLELELESIESPELLALEIQKEQVNIKEEEAKLLRAQRTRSFLSLPYVICDIPRAIVVSLDCRPGDLITEGKQVLSLVDASSLLVEATVAEEFISRINLGDKAIIRPLAAPGKEFEGTVSSIAGMAQDYNNETVVSVKIDYIDEENFLLPNFNVDVEILVTPPEEETVNQPEA